MMLNNENKSWPRHVFQECLKIKSAQNVFDYYLNEFALINCAYYLFFFDPLSHIQFNLNDIFECWGQTK